MDEAYIDFAKDESFVAELASFNRLVVLQTFSKSFGLAGIRFSCCLLSICVHMMSRCGMAFGNPAVIQLMNNVKAPYNINKLSSKVALEALSNISQMYEKRDLCISERERVSKALMEIPTVSRVYPSDSNFVLFRVRLMACSCCGAYMMQQIEDAQAIYLTLAQTGVVIRYRGNQAHCDNCLRASIGTPTDNDELLRRLKQLVEDRNQLRSE